MLKTVRALDNVYGDRNFSIILDDHIFHDLPEGTSNVYYRQTDDVNGAIQAVNDYLGSNDWQYVNQIYYADPSNNIPYYSELLERFYHIAKKPLVGHFNLLNPDPCSGEININDVATGTYDYSLLTIGSEYGSCDYRTGGNSLSSSNVLPWEFKTTLETSSSGATNYSLHIMIEFRVLPTDVLVNGKWDISTDDKIRSFLVNFRFNYNTLLHTVTSTDVSVYLSQLFNVKDIVVDALNDTTPDPQTPDTDPYSGDGVIGGQGESETGGGTDTSGAINWTIGAGDATPVPSLPSLSVADTGFITLYNPSATQLKNLANYMWGNLFDVSTWKKVLADPMDAIIGLSLVPVNVPSGGSQVVTVGNISTGISLNKASTQFVEVDCGTVKIDEIWKAYLDYSPYTKISIYLPYIGSQELDIDLYQNSTVGVKYHIDILSGACVAYITVNGNVICQFSGQCAVSIPITSQDFTQTITALATLVASGVGVVATGGMSAPVQGAAIAGMATAAANTAANVISSKPIYAKTGNMAGSNGLMGVQTPYLIIEHARQCAPAYQNRFTGYPSYITKTLSSISGFTQIQDIRLDNIGCTSEERNEILQLLRSGVIL